MSNLWFARAGNALVPTDDESWQVIRRMGDGELVYLRVMRVRSLRWHKLFMATCAEIGKNQDPQRATKSIYPEVVWFAGHREFLTMDKNRAIFVPKSIAFSELSADEWADLWPSLELSMLERFGMGPENLPHRAQIMRLKDDDA